MLYLTADETRSMIDRDALRRAIGEVMIEVSAGRVSMPPRVAAQRDEPFGVMAVMPAHVPALGAMATKVVNVFPANAAAGLPTHQAVVLVVDPDTGAFSALLDGDTITAERTAAGSALSVDLLARPDSSVLTVMGTGVQARSHLGAASRVRRFTEIRLWGRRQAAALALATELQRDLHQEITVVSDAESACRGADVICATTDAGEPIVRGAWVQPGTHVASVGFSADGPEVDSDLVERSRVIVESRPIAFGGYPVGSHDLRIPLEAGLIDETHVVAEIGEVAAALRPGRTAPDEITLYKSAGLAAQDVAAARLIVDRAIAEGVGTELSR